ncbi:MAG: hypothetical protein IPP79_00005 [Chitinophagaceae bacterium]|nr:hypothetical protein [Chitinophagaceae bacterium]
MEQTGLVAWSGMSSLPEALRLCNLRKHQPMARDKQPLTRKACVMALRNAEKELLCCAVLRLVEMNVGGM